MNAEDPNPLVSPPPAPGPIQPQGSPACCPRRMAQQHLSPPKCSASFSSSSSDSRPPSSLPSGRSSRRHMLYCAERWMLEAGYAWARTEPQLAGAGGCSHTALGPQDLLSHTTKGRCVSAPEAGASESPQVLVRDTFEVYSRANFYIFTTFWNH